MNERDKHSLNMQRLRGLLGAAVTRRRSYWGPEGLGSSGIGVIGLAPVADRDDADRVLVAEFVDDAVDADTVGSQTGQASSQLMARLRIAFEFTEGVQDRVRQEKVELGESIARRAGQDNLGHDASATAGGVLGAYLLERHHVTGGEVVEPAADRRERVLVGEDLGGFLQGLVLIDGHEDRSRTAASGDGHVFAAVGDLIEQLGETGAELADGHGLGHS